MAETAPDPLAELRAARRAAALGVAIGSLSLIPAVGELLKLNRFYREARRGPTTSVEGKEPGIPLDIAHALQQTAFRLEELLGEGWTCAPTDNGAAVVRYRGEPMASVPNLLEAEHRLEGIALALLESSSIPADESEADG